MPRKGDPLIDCMDAKVWAEEFKATFPDLDIDESTMLGWFANAIMNGYDIAERKQERKIERLEAIIDDYNNGHIDL